MIVTTEKTAGGQVTAWAPFPGEQAMIAGQLELAEKGQLPIDHWLAPFSVLVTVVTVLGCLLSALRARFPRR